MGLGQAQSKHNAAKTRLEASNKNKAALAANIDQTKTALNQQKYVSFNNFDTLTRVTNIIIRLPLRTISASFDNNDMSESKWLGLLLKENDWHVSIIFMELLLTFDIRTVLDTKQKELVGLKQQHETKTQEIGKTNEVIKKLTADIAAKDVEIKNFHEKIKVTQEYVLGGLKTL